MEYEFNSEHHFFQEITVFSTVIVGLNGVLALAR